MIGRLLSLFLLLHAGAAAAADVSGTVLIDGRPAANLVVYLEGASAPPPATPPRIVMDQRNLAFVPSVLAVRRGTVVEFTNSDDVQHNVFTPSDAGAKFNLGTYNRGEARSVLFDRPGEAVVLCNIHMEMEAHIVVLDGPYFAVTDEAGGFRIRGMPAGRSTLRLWRRGWLSYTRDVDVGEEPVELVVDAGR